MAIRNVTHIVPGIRTVEGGGFIVRRPFPTQQLQQFDPFLLLDEMGPADFGPGQAVGAPDHPHRGFETVSYILRGSVEHRDSAGHAGRIGPGDVQWMTAGAGVVHSEMPGEELRKLGGRMHGFQLWVNLPAKDKMAPPRYQDFPGETIPEHEQNGVKVRVIAGSAGGKHSPIETRIPILYLHVTLAPGASFTQPIPETQNAFVYIFSGQAAFEGREKVVVEGDMAVLARAGDEVVLRNASDVPLEALILAGEPIREPVARYGPFVMNTPAEIHQAIEDYQAGRMGRIA